MIKFANKIINTPEVSGVEYYISSDLHFFHKNIMKFCASTRPYTSVEEMNEALISHWNSVVKKDDVIIHVGDFSFGKKEATESILRRLNGNIVYLYGNHDSVLRNAIQGLTAYDYLEFIFNGVKVCLSHYPMTVWNQSGRGSVQLFGHVHGSYEGKGRQLDVGFDNHGRILKLQEALDMCLEKDIYSPDHH